MSMASTGASQRDPATGWSVWGQSAAVSILDRAIDHGLSHSWVFTGPAGIGKRLAALDFARSLVCEQAGTPNVRCGSCSRCRRLDRGVLPDVSVFDLAGQAEREKGATAGKSLTIATVRAISASLAYRPLEANWRVVIVDDVETMQETAQEAFLKTLEEPPPFAVIVLVTSDLDRMLPTIQSRCRIVRFGLSPVNEIEARLLAGGSSETDADRIAGLAEGSMGWAIEAATNPALVEERDAIRRDAESTIAADAFGRSVAAMRLADDYAKNPDDVLKRVSQYALIWRERLLSIYIEKSGNGPGGLPGDNARALAQAIGSVESCLADLQANVRPRAALLAMVGAWLGA